MTGNTNGIHHLAIATADIKRQIEFFSDVLGAELVALYWMHGVEGAWHGFMKLNDSCSFAFVQMPAIADVEPELGVTHAGNAAGACAPGSMQHVALNVDTLDELVGMRDRIRSRGVTVIGPLDHGMCHSIYFAGPEDLTLEVATSAVPIDGDAWIDPEVVELAGIDADELTRFRNPAAYDGESGGVAQPEFDPSMPWPRGYPAEVYTKIVRIRDDEFTAKFSEPEPPNPVNA